MVVGLPTELELLIFSFSEIEREIKRSQKLIVDYKEELKKSRVIRRHRQEYDAMAKVRCFISLQLYHMTLFWLR